MLPRRRCPFCLLWFHPHPRLKQQQKTCGRPECRQKQKRRFNQHWRAKNPDYFRGTYPRQKAKYGTRANHADQNLWDLQAPVSVADAVFE